MFDPWPLTHDRPRSSVAIELVHQDAVQELQVAQRHPLFVLLLAAENGLFHAGRLERIQAQRRRELLWEVNRIQELEDPASHLKP